MRVEGDRPLVNVRTIQLLLTLLDILGQLVTGSPKIPRIIVVHGVPGPGRTPTEIPLMIHAVPAKSFMIKQIALRRQVHRDQLQDLFRQINFL